MCQIDNLFLDRNRDDFNYSALGSSTYGSQSRDTETRSTRDSPEDRMRQTAASL